MIKPSERLLYGPPKSDGAVPFWRMQTIWEAAKGKPEIPVRLENLNILDDIVWFGGPKDIRPTVRNVAERARDIFASDLTYPIIMTVAGEVVDGAHRIAKAYLQDMQVISAVLIDALPEADGFVKERE